jgi:hypothetical protein
MRRPRVNLNLLLEILGVACFAVFAYFVYVPLPLLVVGVACIIIVARRVSDDEGES